MSTLIMSDVSSGSEARGGEVPKNSRVPSLENSSRPLSLTGIGAFAGSGSSVAVSAVVVH